ncbi:MAG: hypothetical protein HY820_01095 [Acidobacteria bacterium]|nr:hypothetical protein [Acidobacteriota bacterium]
MRMLTQLILTAALAVSAFAADVNGKWKLTFEINGQTRESTLTLKADAGKLTGKMESQRGAADIQDGKLDGDNISFVVVRNFNGNEVKQQYKGTLKGDEIKFKVTFGDMEREQTAKRMPVS